MPVDMNEVAGRKPIHRKAPEKKKQPFVATSTVVQNQRERKVCPRCKGNVVVKKTCVLCNTEGLLPDMPFHRTKIKTKEQKKDPLWSALNLFMHFPTDKTKESLIKALKQSMTDVKREKNAKE